MKRFFAILLAGVMSASLLACGNSSDSSEETSSSSGASANESSSGTGESSSEASSEFRVGVTCKDLTIDSYAAITAFMTEMFEEEGIEYTMLSADNDPTTMVNQVENFIVADVGEIIIMEPIDQNSLTAPVQEAMDEGIKVLSYGYETEGQYTALICDNYEVGYQTALQVVEWAEEEHPDEVIEIALLTLDISNPEAKKRRDGVVEGLEELYSGKYEIVSEQIGQTTEEGSTLSENIMQANPDLDCFINNSGSAALGCNETVKAAGMLDSIRVFTCDSTPDILNCIYNEEDNAIKSCVSVGADSYMAQTMVEISCMIRDGEEVEPLYLAEVESIDRSNVEEFAANDGYELK